MAGARGKFGDATNGGGIKFGTSGGRNARLNRVQNEKKRREKGRDKEKKCTLSKPKFKEREREGGR